MGTLAIGRADTGNRADGDNAYFDCKVLSKKHAKLVLKGNKLYLQDLGSTNGTYINKFRLSRPGKPSKAREIFTGDIVQFGSLVTQIQPIIATITIANQDGGLWQKRCRNSVLFTPAASQEDITVISEDSDDNNDNSDNGEDQEVSKDKEWQMSKESMILLKEKILEMQKGMEFLSIKERDYEDLQVLAEEEAETICELEKENYKLKTALANIESRISHEKEKYMKLAEYEAETICNLEKENFKLSDLLSQAERNLSREKEKCRVLENKHSRALQDFETKSVEESQNQTNSQKEIQDLQQQLQRFRSQLTEMEKENEKLKLKERLDEATECDVDMLIEQTQFQNEKSLESKEDKAPRSTQDLVMASSRPQRLDTVLALLIGFFAFILGFAMQDTF